MVSRRFEIGILLSLSLLVACFAGLFDQNATNDMAEDALRVTSE